MRNLAVKINSAYPRSEQLRSVLLYMFNLTVVRTSIYTHACLLFPLRLSREVLFKLCLLYQRRETVNLLRNKTKRRKLCLSHIYTNLELHLPNLLKIVDDERDNNMAICTS